MGARSQAQSEQSEPQEKLDSLTRLNALLLQDRAGAEAVALLARANFGNATRSRARRATPSAKKRETKP